MVVSVCDPVPGALNPWLRDIGSEECYQLLSDTPFKKNREIITDIRVAAFNSRTFKFEF